MLPILAIVIGSAAPRGVHAVPEDADPSPPPYDPLYLDEEATRQPAAVVRTAAVDEDDWKAIGRELRERAPGADEFVVFFYGAGSADLPADYATNDEAKGRSERWLIGYYRYVALDAEIRQLHPALESETVSQNRIEARVVEIGGIRVTELSTYDSPGTPDVGRFAGATVASPSLEPATLDAIVDHYKGRFGTPRVLKIMVFEGEPDWPNKPIITPDINDHRHLCYRLAQDAEPAEDGWKLTPREPEWLVVGEDGTLVPADPPADAE